MKFWSFLLTLALVHSIALRKDNEQGILSYNQTDDVFFQEDLSLNLGSCPIEKGFCVTSNGGDQNSGVIKVNSYDGNTIARQADCLKACRARAGATGCEVIWSQGNRGCYIHTQAVARGNGVDRHMCWILSKCGTCPIEKGFCVKSNGGDQNSGVIKVNSYDGNTIARQADCLRACRARTGATGCEVIWSQGNRGCYIHTQAVARGNGVARHMCWIFSKCVAKPKEPFKTEVALSSNGRGIVTNTGKEKFNDDFYSCPVVRYIRNGKTFAVYVRTTKLPEGFDAYSLFTYKWSSANNILNTNFKLYSNFDDAVGKKNAWTFCNYDDQDVGFPRDCGPTGPVGSKWFSMPGDRFTLHNSAKFYIQVDYPKGQRCIASSALWTL